MFRFSIALLLLATAGPICPASFARAAPAPLPRPAVPNPDLVLALAHDDLAGDWNGTWNGIDCPTTLSPSGSYRCTYSGSDWFGTWHQDSSGSLIIEATTTDFPAVKYAWAVTWRRNSTGRLDRASLAGDSKRLDTEDKAHSRVVMSREKK